MARRPPPPPARPVSVRVPPPGVQADFQAGVDLHNAGRLDEAAARYRAVLAVQPRHAATLSFLGVLRQQQGALEEAVSLTGAAVRADGGNAVYLLHHGNALQSAGRTVKALGIYQQAMRLAPNSADIATNLGCALRTLRRYEEAEAWQRRAVAAEPRHALSHLNLGGVLADMGRRDEAAAVLATAIALDPGLVAAYHGLAVVQTDLGRLPAAHQTLARAWSLAPGRADLASALGTLAQAEGRLAEAVEWHRQAAAAAPDVAEIHYNLGNALMALGRGGEAADCFRRALALQPGLFAAATNLSHALAASAAPAEREALLDRVVAETGLPAARFSRGVLRLEQGRLAEGWPDYNARFDGELARFGRQLPCPRWDGADAPGRTVLVWREQGVGDELMFASVLPDLAAAYPAMRFIFECDARMRALFARSLSGITVRAAYQGETPATDFHLPLGHAAALVRSTLAGFPARADGGYLRADATRRADWGQRLDGLGPGLRMGLCWRSTLQTRDRRHAYLDAADVAPLLVLPGVHAVNLQAQLSGEELAAFGRLPGAALHGWSDLDLMQDLDGVAALIAGLDLVVTAATSIGELAASLGVPVWRLAPGRDWTHLGTGVRPWYPAMRIITPAPGQPFTAVVDTVRTSLAALRHQRSFG